MESVGAWVAVLQAGLSVLADTVGEEVKRASEGETAPSQALDVRVERERLMRFTVWPVIGDVCELKCDVLVFCLRFYVYVRRLYLYGDDTRTFPPLRSSSLFFFSSLLIFPGRLALGCALRARAQASSHSAPHP